MKGILLIVAVLFIILISGCTIPGSDEIRAMELASQTTEGQIMAKMYDAFNRIQYCTMQDITAFMSTMPDAPQLTQEQIQQIDAQLEIIKTCIPSISIRAKDMTDGIYNVEYTSIPPVTCTNPQMMESFTTQEQPVLIIEANLNDNSTRVIKGEMGIDSAQIQEVFTQMDALGDCAGMALMAFTTFITGSPQASSQPLRSEVQPEVQ